MLYFVTDHPAVVADIKVKLVTGSHDEAVRAAGETGDWWIIDRNSIKSQLQAATLAGSCNELRDSTWKVPNQYVWVDQGSHHYPRYDVVRVPQVGDKVSYAFNGDSYPCGEITKVSDFKALGNGVSCRRVEAQEEDGRIHIFWRVGQTGSWRKDRTWSLVQGHRNERNPSF